MEVDKELRSLVAAVEGRRLGPAGKSFHLHQLDGERLEAMVYLDPMGARVDWVHGKGDCAITGEGEAMLALLRGEGDAGLLAHQGRLTLYGDLALVQRAPEVFR